MPEFRCFGGFPHEANYLLLLLSNDSQNIACESGRSDDAGIVA